MIEDAEILDIVSRSASIEDACRKLIALANEHGGEDNITAVLVKIEDEPGDQKVSLSDTLPTPLTSRMRPPGSTTPTAPDAHADTPPAGSTKPKE
jgi:protein phosphatase